jgi:charged multivesicular body protein 5
VLKQKRMYEGQREQLYNQQLNLEQVSFATQSARDTAVQVQAMQASAKELKAQFKTKAFDVDKIDALNDEMADLMDQANEIQEVLGRDYNVPDDIDEDELLGELDALEDLMAEEETGEEVPSYLRDEALPDAPDLQPLPAAGAGGMPAEPATQQQQQRVEETERTTAQ